LTNSEDKGKNSWTSTAQLKKRGGTPNGRGFEQNTNHKEKRKEKGEKLTDWKKNRRERSKERELVKNKSTAHKKSYTGRELRNQANITTDGSNKKADIQSLINVLDSVTGEHLQERECRRGSPL